MERSETIGKLVLALSKAQAVMKPAKKNAFNPHWKNHYADLASCIEAAEPALTAHELSVIQVAETDEQGRAVIISILAHSSGEYIKGKLVIKPRDFGAQSLGSAISYGRRYSYKAIVGLPDEDDDGNAAALTPKPQKKDNFI